MRSIRSSKSNNGHRSHVNRGNHRPARSGHSGHSAHRAENLSGVRSFSKKKMDNREPDGFQESYRTQMAIKHTDKQGHVSYRRGFGEAMDISARKVIKKLPFEPDVSHEHTTYLRQIHIGDQVQTCASLLDQDKDDSNVVSVQKDLFVIDPDNPKKKPVKHATSYTVLNLPEDYADIEIGGASDKYVPSENSYKIPSKVAPSKPIGKEVKLDEDDSQILRNQVGPDGFVSSLELFDILHTHAYENAVMKGTGEGFAESADKPVMATSSVIKYGELREGDNYKIFVYANQNERKPSKYSWTATITDLSERVKSVVTCDHVLLKEKDGKDIPKSKDEINPKFYEHLSDLSVEKGYENLFVERNNLVKGHRHFTTSHLDRTDKIYQSVINVKGQPLNVVTGDFLKELDDILLNVKDGVLITKSGQDGCYVAGADIKDFAKAETREELMAFSAAAQNSFCRLAERGRTIAIMSGNALGGGLELAMAHDIRLATPDAKFGLVEVLLGVIPAFDGFQRLTELVGLENAVRLIVSGTVLNAEQGLRLGIIDGIVSNKSDVSHVARNFDEYMSTRIKKPYDKEQAPIMLDGIKEDISHRYGMRTGLVSRLYSAHHEIENQTALNLNNYIDGPFNAKIAALGVFKKQSQTDDPVEKRMIEREAFADIALTPGAKFATQFYVLDKGSYPKEHAVLKAYPKLLSSGAEIDFSKMASKEASKERF